MQIKPFPDYIILRQVVQHETAGGLTIPEKHAPRLPYGEVLAAGVPLNPKHSRLLPGDVVLFNGYAAQRPDPSDEQVVVLTYEEIIGWVTFDPAKESHPNDKPIDFESGPGSDPVG